MHDAGRGVVHEAVSAGHVDDLGGLRAGRAMRIRQQEPARCGQTKGLASGLYAEGGAFAARILTGSVVSIRSVGVGAISTP